MRREETEDKDGNKVETRKHHLMSGDNGEFPIGSLNDWERDVLDSEMSEPSFRAWYRNPSRPSDDALAIAYKDGQDNWRRMCPDFLFFTGEDKRLESDSRVMSCIVHAIRGSRQAMEELEAGKGKRFDSADALFKDLGV